VLKTELTPLFPADGVAPVLTAATPPAPTVTVSELPTVNDEMPVK
jgi:hypothetical protein